MAHYILLMTLSQEGRTQALRDPDYVVRAQGRMSVPDVVGLGMYAVLGACDFVAIIEAPDNDAAARYSLRFGVEVGAHVETLPAVPIGELLGAEGDEVPTMMEGVELGAPDEEP